MRSEGMETQEQTTMYQSAVEGIIFDHIRYRSTENLADINKSVVQSDELPDLKIESEELIKPYQSVITTNEKVQKHFKLRSSNKQKRIKKFKRSIASNAVLSKN